MTKPALCYLVALLSRTGRCYRNTGGLASFTTKLTIGKPPTGLIYKPSAFYQSG